MRSTDRAPGSVFGGSRHGDGSRRGPPSGLLQRKATALEKAERQGGTTGTRGRSWPAGPGNGGPKGRGRQAPWPQGGGRQRACEGAGEILSAGSVPARRDRGGRAGGGSARGCRRRQEAAAGVGGVE